MPINPKARTTAPPLIRSPNASSPSISTVEAVESQSHDHTSNPRGALDSGTASSDRKPVIMLNVAAQSQEHLDSATIIVESLRPAGPCARNRVLSCSRTALKVRLSTETCALVDLNSKFVSANRPSSAVVIVRYYCGFLAVMMWLPELA
jgi:hypothetical protein